MVEQQAAEEKQQLHRSRRDKRKLKPEKKKKTLQPVYSRYSGSIDIMDLRTGTYNGKKEDEILPGLFDENGKLVLEKVEPFIST